MKKAKRRVSLLVLSALGLTVLAACATNNTGLTVDFKVLNTENVWTTVKTENVVDGKVNVPDAPEKQYYDFAGWYNSETYEAKFVETGITESCSAFGKYVAQEVTVHINDEAPVVKNLVDVVNATYNPGEGLVFDGWYKDAAMQVKWNGTETVSELYASSMAMVTFNNGYEDVYTTLVKPGTIVKNPAETEFESFEGEVSTLEKEEIVEFYMDEKDINYVDDEGKAFDFTKPMNKSTTITVNWNTLGLRNRVRYNADKDFYYYEYDQAQDQKPYPALSFQGKATIETENENKEKVEKEVEVSSYYSYGKVLGNVTKKVIFGEGLKSIAGFNGEAANNVEEIQLPSTLKVLDNCFNNLTKLKGIDLPEGLEVLIGSFFKRTSATDLYKDFQYGAKHDFEILVPASVKNIALAPTNLTFAEGSNFYKEDGRIFLKENNEKILISDADNLNNSTIVVPEGVTGIQTGTYHAQFDYLILPSTFKFMNLNADVSEYPYYVFNEGSSWSISANHLYDKANAGNGSDVALESTAMSPLAYSISDNLGGATMVSFADWVTIYRTSFGIVKFNNDKVPATLNKYAFVGDAAGTAFLMGGFQPMDTEALATNVVLNDNEENLYITLRGENLSGSIYEFESFSAVTPTRAIANVEELVEIIRLANPDAVERINASIAGAKSLFITSNNKDIKASDIKGEMFITIEIEYL